MVAPCHGLSFKRVLFWLHCCALFECGSLQVNSAHTLASTLLKTEENMPELATRDARRKIRTIGERHIEVTCFDKMSWHREIKIRYLSDTNKKYGRPMRILKRTVLRIFACCVQHEMRRRAEREVKQSTQFCKKDI